MTFVTDLKTVYTAVNEEVAMKNIMSLKDKWDKKKHMRLIYILIQNIHIANFNMYSVFPKMKIIIHKNIYILYLK